jgi:hypothetical protein
VEAGKRYLAHWPLEWYLDNVLYLGYYWVEKRQFGWINLSEFFLGDLAVTWPSCLFSIFDFQVSQGRNEGTICPTILKIKRIIEDCQLRGRSAESG